MFTLYWMREEFDRKFRHRLHAKHPEGWGKFYSKEYFTPEEAADYAILLSPLQKG